jgi:hypothetical protein
MRPASSSQPVHRHIISGALSVDFGFPSIIENSTGSTSPCARGVANRWAETVANAPPELTVSLNLGLFPADDLY